MTIRELISNRNLKMDASYEAWLDRLRRENQESERQRAEAREFEYDRNVRHRLDAYYGVDELDSTGSDE